MVKSVLLLHGGAGSWRIEEKKLDRLLKAIKDAYSYGYSFLKDGSATEAVVEAVAYMEDDGSFNAGSGSVLNLISHREMDAGVMDGHSLRIGAVAAVRYPKNPIRLAKIIMDRSDHVFLVGEGADEIARRLKLPAIGAPKEEITKKYDELLEEYKEGRWKIYGGNLEMARKLGLVGTVGAVALDKDGNLASAVSTGGVWLKMPGRVGDSSIPGAGFYSDEHVAISATGIGEYIIRSMPCMRISMLVQQGYELKESMRIVMKLVNEVFGRNNMGLIAVDNRGEWDVVYNTEHILIAYRDEKGIKSRLL